jgi:hypothetical protein
LRPAGVGQAIDKQNNVRDFVSLRAAWQDMSLSESPSALGAVSRFAPRMPLLNPISTERSLYLS